MKNRCLFFIILTICLTVESSAQSENVNIFERLVQTETLAYKLFRSENPAIQLYKQDGMLSNVQFFYDHRKDKEKTFATYLGDEEKLSGVSVNSFLKLKADFVMWGMVEYNRIFQYNIRGSSVEDYSLLYPQIVSFGPKHQERFKEQYRLKGGATKRLSRFTLGFEMDYLAYQSVVRLDPRPESIAGDLLFRAGSSYQIKNALVHLGASFRRYKQDFTVINSSGATLKGQKVMQGPVYKDSSIPELVSIDLNRVGFPYKGNTRGVFGGLAMRGDKGINLHLGFDESTITRLFSITNFKQNLSSLNSKRSNATLSIHTDFGKHFLGMQAEAVYTHKLLTAYMIYKHPTITLHSLRVGEVKTWFSDEYDTRLRLLYNINSPRLFQLECSSFWGVYHFQEKLLMPLQSTINQLHIVGGDLVLRKNIKNKHRFVLDLSCEFRINNGHRLLINQPIQGQRDKFRPVKFNHSDELMFKQNFDHRVSNAQRFIIGLKYAYAPKSNYAFFISSNFEQLQFGDSQKQNRFCMALGVDF